MEKQCNFLVEIIAEEKFIDLIKKESVAAEKDISIISEKHNIKTIEQPFGLIELAALIAVIQGIFYLGELAIKIVKWMKETKTERVTINTQVCKNIIIINDDNLTVEYVLEKLKKSVEINDK
jgi:hypothetical protein